MRKLKNKYNKKVNKRIFHNNYKIYLVKHKVLYHYNHHKHHF